MDKLKSGNYRVKRQVNGKRYSLTFDHIPTENEIMIAVVNKANSPETRSRVANSHSFEEAVKLYNELKKDRNSPSTKREYSRLTNHFTEKFNKMDVKKITQLDVDTEIANWLKKGLSYKTMKNYISMAKTVITKYGGIEFNLDMLPEKPKKEEKYIPTPNDVKRLLVYIKDEYPMMYIPFWLSAYGLRRGEVCALDPATDIDYKNAIVNITKDLVENSDKEWVIKEPKTQASKRPVAVSKALTDLIKQKGVVYEGHPNSINKALHRAQKALGIPRFNLHYMRHFCCTELYDAGYTETDIMAYMGWEKESDVMRTVYKHSRLKKDKERQRILANKLDSKIL